jgi:iron complex transport system permease protein
MLFGGAFLVFSDTVSRVIVAPYELPVGIVTTMIGAVFFIFLVRRKV